MGFPTSHQPRFYAAQLPKFVIFWTILTIKDEKSAAKFHYIKTVSGKVVAQQLPLEWYQYIGRGSIRSLDIWTQRDRTLLEAHALHTLRLIARQPWRHCVTGLQSLTGWPVAWNWRRAVLSADGGLLVALHKIVDHITWNRVLFLWRKVEKLVWYYIQLRLYSTCSFFILRAFFKFIQVGFQQAFTSFLWPAVQSSEWSSDNKHKLK